MVCPPLGAWRLAEGWKDCELRMVPASGHALSEPMIAAELGGRPWHFAYPNGGPGGFDGRDVATVVAAGFSTP